LELKTNNAEFGGKVIYKDDLITVIPGIIMKERVTNGALKQYKEFAPSAHWFANMPLVPPHKEGDPPINHLTPKLGKVLSAWANPKEKRIDSINLIYNDRIAPNDLERIWRGETFGNSPGYYCNDEKLPAPEIWTDGTEYKTKERGPYYPNHVSFVPRGACPLPHCGMNLDVEIDENKIAHILEGLKLNSKEPDNMTEVTPKVEPVVTPVEPPKVNTEIKPEIVSAQVNVENKIDLSAVLTKLDSISGEVATMKTNMDALANENKTLKEAEALRANAAKEASEIAAKAGFRAFLKANFQADAEKLYPEYVANPAMWIVTNAEKIDLTPTATVRPMSQAFVPHVNTEDDEELKGMMPTDEQAGMRKVA
jgi:hypothetical protein